MDKWISVNDRLPEMAGEYLVPMNGGVAVVRFVRSSQLWVDYAEEHPVVRKNITHWMPLPEPPKE